VTVGTSVKYYISDPIKALLEVHNYDESLQNVVLVVVCSFVNKHNLASLQGLSGELTDLLLREVREASKGWGIKIQNVSITDLGDTTNFRLLVSGVGE